MTTFKDSFNPTLKTLLAVFEHIAEHQPVPMDTIPLCRSAGYKWLWGMKDNGWLHIERSKKDGRSHLVRLTVEGLNVWSMLQKIKDADNIKCHKCGEHIARFFKIPNDEWKDVTGDEHDQVICKNCFDRMKEEAVLCGGK